MQASVVIPTYERPDKLRGALSSICEQTIDDYEVIVVDDGSESDAQKTVLKDFARCDRVMVVRQANAGPAAARNTGWRRASGEKILFTDDDCIVPDDWVESLVSSFEDGVAGVGGPLLPTEELLATNRLARAHKFRDKVEYKSPDRPVRGLDGLNVGGTANVAYRQLVLEKVGGFDESFPLAAGEDADLQDRILAAGWEMKYVPTVVRHNDDYKWRSFIERAVRSGRGTQRLHEKKNNQRPIARIILGLLGSPILLLPALWYAKRFDEAILFIIERMLNRVGELIATIERR